MGKESLSEDVSKVIDVIDKSGIEYRLTSMGTIVEGSPDDVWDLIRKCHDKMRELSRRVITHVAVDDRESAVDSIRTKVNDIEKHLSRKLKT